MKKEDVKKVGVFGAIIVATVLLSVAIHGMITPEIYENVPTYFGVDEPEWNTIQVIKPDENGKLSPVGEFAAGAGVSSWLSFFCYDYAENPLSLKSNQSAGDYGSWGNVSGYADSDNWNMDLASEDPFYFVCRVRFNKTHLWGDSMFKGSRARVTLTVSGDETITAVTITGNNTVWHKGGGMESHNDTGSPCIWMNFFWDDPASDGYRITDDGTLTISLITIEARY